MKLNPDCVRDVLQAVEDITDFRTIMRFPFKEEEAKHLTGYTVDEIFYHIKQCDQSGLIKVTWMMGPSCLIHDLSPAGHEFLANIRNDTNWAKTKEIANQVGSFSLKALTQIAIGVVTKLINQQL